MAIHGLVLKQPWWRLGIHHFKKPPYVPWSKQRGCFYKRGWPSAWSSLKHGHQFQISIILRHIHNMYPIYGAVRRLGGYSVWQFYNWKIDDQQWDVERPYLAQKPMVFGRSFRWDIHTVGHETKGNMMINHVGFWGIYNFYLYYMHTYTSHYIHIYIYMYVLYT